MKKPLKQKTKKYKNPDFFRGRIGVYEKGRGSSQDLRGPHPHSTLNP
jgi:hypothetical protein